jgi:hypothetical protein
MRFRPRFIGGVLGAGLAAALYIGDSTLRAQGGSGLPLAALVVLLAPGALAAWAARRQEIGGEAEREGSLAGLLTAHFASALLVAMLVVGVVNIDWAAYGRDVGSQIASEVREAVVPAAAVAAVVSLAIVYAGCVVLSWLGALLYKRLAGVK